MKREVVFAPEALIDLRQLYTVIAIDAGAGRAQSYTDRIAQHCLGLMTFPDRGVARDDLRPGLRTIAFRRRVTVAFHVSDGAVTVDRILYGGRDLEAAFEASARPK